MEREEKQNGEGRSSRMERGGVPHCINMALDLVFKARCHH